MNSTPERDAPCSGNGNKEFVMSGLAVSNHDNQNIWKEELDLGKDLGNLDKNLEHSTGQRKGKLHQVD